MSENYDPRGGTPNPYGNPNPYVEPQPAPQPEPPVYFDPNNNPNASSPGVVITGNPGGGKSSPYVYPQYAPGRNYGAISRKEANTQATIALFLGIVSFFSFGLLFSIPGYILAKQAEVANGETAKIAKITNLVNIGVCVVVGVLFIIVVAIAGANHLQ